MLVVVVPRPLLHLPRQRLAELTGVGITGTEGPAAQLASVLRGLPNCNRVAGLVGEHLGDTVTDLLTATLAAQLHDDWSARRPTSHSALTRLAPTLVP